ncbi:MAG TPA: potassium channel family protein, partial [Vicinamibacterales bacterium]|nr:potassium channel family protein [Vicinamibacterales bacterium]
MGYANVRHYKGGLVAWQERGGALEAEVLEEPDIVPVLVRPPEGEMPAAVRTSRRATARTPWAVRALDAFGDRSVGQLLSLWLGVVLACGILYWLADYESIDALRESGAVMGHSWRDLLTAEYFSFVTATSVGFGDVVPAGLSRVLAVVEAMAGLVIFGSLISKFVSRRQDRIIAEIHQTTFEEGLARVRTNL